MKCILRVFYHDTTSSFEELQQKHIFCLNTLQKYTSLDHRNVRGLQGDVSNDFDGGPPTDSAFELYHETPT